MHMYKRLVVGLALGALPLSAANADPVADFYKGKTVNFYIGSAPGGGYDVYARMIIRTLGKHIPGKPDIIPRNMPGGSSRVAAAYVYTVAPKDGTAVVIINQELPLAQAMGEQMPFDVGKFYWLGTPDYDNRVVAAWHASGVKTIADAKAKEVTMGASGPTEASGYVEMLNTLFGTKFRSIRGYTGGAAINLAMERGEVDGRADNAWSSYKSDHPEWIADKKIAILVQVGLSKAADLADVPLLSDLASNADDRLALKLISSSPTFGHAVVAAPGVPADRAAALRRAFAETMTDPVFLADAKAQRRPIEPVSGEDLAKFAAEMVSASPQVVARAKALAGTGE